MKIIDIMNMYATGKVKNLPKKIEVDGITYTLNYKFHYVEDNEELELFDTLNKGYYIEEMINMKVEEAKVGKRWVFKTGDFYYYNSYGNVLNTYYVKEDKDDKYRILTHNCFKTKEATERHIENEKTYYELVELAEKLNNGNEIDWNDRIQEKYYIYYDYRLEGLALGEAGNIKRMKEIYCLNSNFLKEAIYNIGRQKLINLFIE